jgi:hypothetical protein
MPSSPALVLSLSLAAWAAGCSSLEGEEPRASWGGIVEERPDPTPPLTGALSTPTPSVGPYPVREYTAAEKAFLDEAWTSFKRGAPTWPENKARWMEMGPEARGLLAENLYRALVASRVKGALHLVDEAKKDLVLMGEAAVPVLVGGLAVRAVRTDRGEEIRVGQEVLHDAAETLALLGPPSVPGLLDVVRGGETSQVTEALQALGNIGDPSAEAAILEASRASDWQVRAAAILALRRYGTEGAQVRMVEALEDPESLVVERAAQALATGRHRAAAPEVVDVLERALREGRVLPVRASLFVLRSLTGETLGEDPDAWRARLGGR